MRGSQSHREYKHDPDLLISASKKLMGVASSNTHPIDVSYVSLLNLMSEKEFAHAYKRIETYQDSTLKRAVDLIAEFMILQETLGKGYHGGHICFIIDAAPASLVFSVDNFHYTSNDVGNAAYRFFAEYGSNDYWTSLATGYTIGTLVDPRFGIERVPISHLVWLTDNAPKLIDIKNELHSRKSVSRELCESLLSTPSLALREGVL